MLSGEEYEIALAIVLVVVLLFVSWARSIGSAEENNRHHRKKPSAAQGNAGCNPPFNAEDESNYWTKIKKYYKTKHCN